MKKSKIKFVQALAVFLVKDQALWSIRLQAGDPTAQVWASLRGSTPLFGYPTVEEGTKILEEWLE